MQTHDEHAADEQRAALSAATINDLPDSAFAYIEPGGEKDADGKTVPRSLRHFPIHDEAHVANALSRAPQSPFGDKAMPKIVAAAKKMGVGEEGRAVPTEQDPKVATALTAAKQAVDDAAGAQSLDPDNDTDPDDAEVSAHIGTAGQALTHALAAQAKDGADEPPQTRRKRERHRAIPLLPEVRYWRPTVEMREGDAANEVILTGTPIVYNAPYIVVDEYGQFEERMLPGAASNLIARSADTRFLFNHDGLPMARSVNDRGAPPTLTLTESAQGLHFSARLDTRQQASSDLVIAIERGDVSQMSVGMIVKRDTWGVLDNRDTRDIHEIGDLLDVSAVTYPASPTTSIEVARRMVLAIPIASHARARKFYADARAGMKMSSDNQSKVLGALQMMHSALGDAGVSLPWDEEEDAGVSEDGTQGGNNSNNEGSDGIGAGSVDGSGLRSAKTLRLQLELRRRRQLAA